MKKALLVLVVYTMALVVMATAPVQTVSMCPKPKPVLTQQLKKPEPKLMACSAVIIPFVWTIHYWCVGGGYGGGGGTAF